MIPMMALNRFKVIFTVLSIALLSQSFTTNAYALTPTFGHKFQNGVGNISIWLNYNSGVGYWQSYITNAANNWMYPGWSNPIYTHVVSSNYGSNIDFHRNNDAYFGGGMSVLAETKLFSNTGYPVNPLAANWYYAEIHINHDVYSMPSISNDKALGTTIHEYGHAFGLAHYQTNPYSIMCQLGAGRVVQRVQKTDNDSINALY